MCAHVEVTNTLDCTSPLEPTRNNHDVHHKKTEGTQRVTTTIYDHRHKAHITNIKTHWGSTVWTQREESKV